MVPDRDISIMTFNMTLKVIVYVTITNIFQYMLFILTDLLFVKRLTMPHVQKRRSSRSTTQTSEVKI